MSECTLCGASVVKGGMNPDPPLTLLYVVVTRTKQIVTANVCHWCIATYKESSQREKTRVFYLTETLLSAIDYAGIGKEIDYEYE